MKSILGTLLLASALALVQLSWPGEAAAQGTEFNLSCDTRNEVLVGIRGRQGWWMDGIAARCRSVGANGRLGSSVRTTAWRGGTGGTQKTFDCGRNEVMVGYSGSQGDNGYVLYVHEVICAPWDPDTKTAGIPVRAVRAFDGKSGFGGGHWIADTCFQGRVGTRLRGRAGIYLDRLTDIGCSYFPGATQPTPAPRPQPIPRARQITVAPVPIGPSGSWNTTLCPDPENPPFSWEPVAGASAYRVEFHNDTRNTTKTKTVSSTRTGPPGVLREGNRYRWRVRAANSLGDGPWSPYLTFTGVDGARAKGPCVMAGGIATPYF